LRKWGFVLEEDSKIKSLVLIVMLIHPSTFPRVKSRLDPFLRIILDYTEI